MVENEALATLTVNKIKGTLRCAAVQAPGHADRRKAIEEDIAILTGGIVLSGDVGPALQNATLSDLGHAEKVVVSKDDTTIIGGGGSEAKIKDRIRSITTQIGSTAVAFEREKLEERLAKLAGCIAVIKAGGISEDDVVRRRYKLETGA